MAQNQLERQLVAAVRAAKQGNRERARELLEGVLRQNRENEQAWIWMASIVTSTKERRICLERVLKINPNNRAARAAINSMVGVIADEAVRIDFDTMSREAKTPLPASVGGAQQTRTAVTTPTVGRSAGRQNILPLLIAVAVVLGLIFAATLIVPALLSSPEPTATAIAIVAETTDEMTEVDTATSINTATPTVANRATLKPNESLQETFTPTVTDTPTNTPTVTATVPAINIYNLVFLAIENNFAPTLYRVNGDGTGLQPMAGNIYDIDLHPDGVMAYTREIEIILPTPTPSPTRTPDPNATQNPQEQLATNPEPQIGIIHKLFLSNLNNPLDALELSNDIYSNAFSPSISPDGQQIAFASDADGDHDIYIYDIPSGTIFSVTNNDIAHDIDPDWSPDGTQMIFASDRESPGHYDLYRLTVGNDAESSVVRVTQTRRGDNIQPQWSPVGDQIAYRNQVGTTMGIRMVTLASGAIRELTSQSNKVYSAPSWTSDGLYLVFTSDSAGPLRQIFFVNPETLQSYQLRLDGLDITVVMPRD